MDEHDLSLFSVPINGGELTNLLEEPIRGTDLKLFFTSNDSRVLIARTSWSWEISRNYVSGLYSVPITGGDLITIAEVGTADVAAISTYKFAPDKETVLFLAALTNSEVVLRANNLLGTNPQTWLEHTHKDSQSAYFPSDFEVSADGNIVYFTGHITNRLSQESRKGVYSFSCTDEDLSITTYFEESSPYESIDGVYFLLKEEHILFRLNKSSSLIRSEVMRTLQSINVSSGKVIELHNNLNNRWNSPLQFTPNGRRVVYEIAPVSDRYNYGSLLSSPIRGGAPTHLSGRERGEKVLISADSHRVIFSVYFRYHYYFQLYTAPVAGINISPTFPITTLIPARTGFEFQQVVDVYDANLTDDILIIGAGLPSWISLTDNGDGTALLVGKPAEENIGIVSFELTASDQFGASTTQSFDLQVVENRIFLPLLNLHSMHSISNHLVAF